MVLGVFDLPLQERDVLLRPLVVNHTDHFPAATTKLRGLLNDFGRCAGFDGFVLVALVAHVSASGTFCTVREWPKNLLSLTTASPDKHPQTPTNDLWLGTHFR